MTDPSAPVGDPLEDPVTSPGPADRSGQIVSHYRILEKLGEGGMGVVYKARDDRLHRTVALKFLPSHLTDNAEQRRRLIQEARAASALDHPNIVVIHDIDKTTDGAMFVAMAFHEGETLQARIRNGLSIADAVSIARQVASGLARAHERGLFHRDIKPSNVIVAANGVARIIDFGLVKEVDATMTVDGGIKGTPLYMSPEQVTGGVIDARTDLWSLGAVLYEMLTGRRPFDAPTVPAVMQAITATDPQPVTAVRPGVPEALAAIVARALAKDPAARYQSATDMARDLAAVEVALTATGAAPVETSPSRPGRRWRAVAVWASAITVAVVAAGAWLYVRAERRQWVTEQAIPQIAALRKSERPLAAFLLLERAQALWPGNPELLTLTSELTQESSLTSSPAGATVEIQDYFAPDGPWWTIGRTPIDKARVPLGYFRWRVSAPGVRAHEAALEMRPTRNFPLDEIARAPDGMVPISESRWLDMVGFLGWVGPYDMPAYDIDRYEVTNRQFQEFVDRGGYEDPKYWREPFVRDGHPLAWTDAMAFFRDSTGRHGPATWHAGRYPDGRAEYPVSGVSWYEAAAFAVFAGKRLPTLAQWYQVAPPDMARYLAQVSNLSASSPAPVGQFQGLGPYGTYDMAGNVREWCTNGLADSDRRFILGGAWTSPAYLYGEPEVLPAFDRTDGNGFRLVRNHGPLPPAALATRRLFARDEAHFKPASDDLFKIYRSLYTYGKVPLQARVDATEDAPDWRREKVSFDAPYGPERVPAYVFLPKHVQPPYEAVVFFPSARVEFLPSSERLGDMEFIDYVIQSGRAVIYPIYQATYERLSEADRQRGATLPTASRGRDVIIQQTKEVQRAVDYLQTRPDIDTGRIGYLGVSMGSAYGAIVDAIETRFKAIVWLDGGLFLDQPLPGTDQVDFAPRVTAPVLMVNGRYDFVFPLETAQRPLFRLLGTPAADKRHVILDTPHDVSTARPELIKQVLAWLDKYLGVVR